MGSQELIQLVNVKIVPLSLFLIMFGMGMTLIPDDFKRGMQPCWGHRLMLGAEAELEGHTSAQILKEILDSVEVPK